MALVALKASEHELTRDVVREVIHDLQEKAEETKIPTKSKRYHQAAADIHEIYTEIDPEDDKTLRLARQIIEVMNTV